MLTCYAVDDEPSALEILNDYISVNPNLSLLKTFSHPLTAFNHIKINERVDIIFLDIEMPEMNGIELAELIRHKARKIVFATGHKEYAYDSIELETEFLLKPVSFKKFDLLITKIFSELSSKDLQIKKPLESFMVKEAGNRSKQYKITLKSVLFFESQLSYTKVSTTTETIFINMSLSKLLELLNTNEHFIQVHRSFIISKEFIKVLGSEHIVMNNNIKIPIGRNYRAQFVKGLSKSKQT